MSEYSILSATISIITAALAIFLAQPFCAFAKTDCDFLRVNDRPLLESMEQIVEARTTPYTSFRIGSDYFVVENLPRGYIDYATECVRMP